MTQDLRSIVHRVDRLERQNRSLKRMLALAVLLPGVVVMVGMRIRTYLGSLSNCCPALRARSRSMSATLKTL